MNWNVTPSEVYPVTTANAKATARIDHDAEDRVVQRLIAAATLACEAFIGQKIMASEYKMSITGTNETVSVDLPEQYLSHTVTFTDANGNTITQVEANVTVEVIENTLELSFNQEVTASITVLAGMTEDPSQVDKRLTMGIELLVEDYYQNRSANTGLPRPVKTLWFPLKKVSA